MGVREGRKGRHLHGHCPSDSVRNIESNIETPPENIREIPPVTMLLTTSYISRGARIELRFPSAILARLAEINSLFRIRCRRSARTYGSGVRHHPCGEAVKNDRAARPYLLRNPPLLHPIAWLLDQVVGRIPIRSRHHPGIRPR